MSIFKDRDGIPKTGPAVAIVLAICIPIGIFLGIQGGKALVRKHEKEIAPLPEDRAQCLKDKEIKKIIIRGYDEEGNVIYIDITTLLGSEPIAGSWKDVVSE